MEMASVSGRLHHRYGMAGIVSCISNREPCRFLIDAGIIVLIIFVLYNTLHLKKIE
jgi:hypothetical protein